MHKSFVLPLTIIHQYAIIRVRELEEKLVQQSPLKKRNEKQAMWCSYGIVIAGEFRLKEFTLNFVRKEEKTFIGNGLLLIRWQKNTS